MSAKKQGDTAQEREARLAEQLRENLRKRKAQARGVAGDQPPGQHSPDEKP